MSRLSCHSAAWPLDRWKEAIEIASGLGFNALEFDEAWFNAYHDRAELLQEELRRFAMTATAAPFQGNIVRPDLHESIAERLSPRLAFLRAMKAERLVMTTGQREEAVDKRQDFLAAARFLNELGKRCVDHDVYLCVQPALDTRIQDEEDIDRLMNAINADEVFLCLDTGHLRRAGLSPSEILKTYGACARHIHLQDAYPIGEEEKESEAFCALGQGDVDFAEFLDIGLNQNRMDSVSIKLESIRRSPEEDLEESIQYWNSLLEQTRQTSEEQP